MTTRDPWPVWPRALFRVYTSTGGKTLFDTYPDEPNDLGYPDEEDYAGSIDFADPGGRSALRAASARNPRNLPCPTCKRPNMLTPADRAHGYQCDICADTAEGRYG